MSIFSWVYCGISKHDCSLLTRFTSNWSISAKTNNISHSKILICSTTRKQNLRDENWLIFSVWKREERITGGCANWTPVNIMKAMMITSQHVLVGIVWDGEDVRRSFSPLLSSVGNNHLLVVDRQPLVGVDCHTEEPRVGLWEIEHKTTVLNVQYTEPGAFRCYVCMLMVHTLSSISLGSATPPPAVSFFISEWGQVVRSSAPWLKRLENPTFIVKWLI